MFTEKVLRIVYLAVFHGYVCQRKSRNLKHRPGAFAIAARYERSVYVYEPAGIEKFVYRESRFAPYAEYRPESVRSRTKIRDFAQIFERVSFLLQRIVGRRSPFDRYLVRLDFKRLFGFGRQNERTFYRKRCAYVLTGDFVVIFKVCPFENDLHALERTSVVKVDKPELFAVADGTRPALYGNGFAAEFIAFFVKRFYCDSFFHNLRSPKIIYDSILT